jgi:hypothetical protein
VRLGLVRRVGLGERLADAAEVAGQAIEVGLAEPVQRVGLWMIVRRASAAARCAVTSAVQLAIVTRSPPAGLAVEAVGGQRLEHVGGAESVTGKRSQASLSDPSGLDWHPHPLRSVPTDRRTDLR